MLKYKPLLIKINNGKIKKLTKCNKNILKIEQYILSKNLLLIKKTKNIPEIVEWIPNCKNKYHNIKKNNVAINVLYWKNLKNKNMIII